MLRVYIVSKILKGFTQSTHLYQSPNGFLEQSVSDTNTRYRERGDNIILIVRRNSTELISTAAHVKQTIDEHVVIYFRKI